MRVETRVGGKTSIGREVGIYIYILVRDIEMSKESRRRLRIRSLRFWKMIQRREEGRSFRNVRVELKDGYVYS